MQLAGKQGISAFSWDTETIPVGTLNLLQCRVSQVNDNHHRGEEQLRVAFPPRSTRVIGL